MAKVEVDIDEKDLPNERGGTTPGICATCSRCAHEVEVFGTSEASVKRACVMLREECPSDERNFYEAST
jgi:hypothetical protein